VPTGDMAEVFGRALDLLIAHHERRKIGARSRVRRSA